MEHASEGLERGLGQQGAAALLQYANELTADINGSTTAVVAVRHKPSKMEVRKGRQCGLNAWTSAYPQMVSGCICCCLTSELGHDFQSLWQVASIGDSGFRLLREGRCIFASHVRPSDNSCPYLIPMRGIFMKIVQICS